MSNILNSLFGGGGATDARNDAVRAEKNRQRLITQGSNQINAIYDGGTVPGWNMVQQGQAFDPNQQYYTSPNMSTYNAWNKPGKQAGFYGQHFQGMMGRNRPLYTKGTDQTYTGFTPDFFNNAAQSYVNYALPQLAQQYKQASDTTTYGLANRGLLNSSVANQQRSDLDLTMGRQKLNIYDTGQQQSQALQKQVQDSKQQALNNLYQVGNPTQAIQSAIGQASQIQSPSIIQPISNAFQGLMNQYAISQLYPTSGQGQMPQQYGYGGYNPYATPTMGYGYNQPPAYY